MFNNNEKGLNSSLFTNNLQVVHEEIGYEFGC